jgi:CheY-like chemotaxis protein
MLLESHDPEIKVPLAFYLQVKQVLENFYDFPYLNQHPLGKAILAPRVRPAETDGQRLRRVFLAGLEELRPGNEAARKSLQARYYNLINVRYVESGTIQHVAHELGISERQTYRDLKRAEESLAAMLWAQVAPEAYKPAPGEPADAQPADNDSEALELQLRPASAQELLKNAGSTVERLAGQQQIVIGWDVPPDPVIFPTDPRLAQQVLTMLLSHILQHARPSQLYVRLEQHASQVIISFIFQPDAESGLGFDNPIASRFIQFLKWKLELGELDASGHQTIRLEAGRNEALVLIIDDHPPLIEVLRRYLTNTRCAVIGVSDGQEGLRLAASLSPNVILLDVMMPEIDGWEVLQRLRNSPQTSQIPVVICSIFDDPKLAYSLGATALLTKPVRREQLFEVLTALKILG